jgi:hypothetical protein
MKRISVSYAAGFKVLIGDDHSQAATMVIVGRKAGLTTAITARISGSMSKAGTAKPGSTATPIL